MSRHDGGVDRPRALKLAALERLQAGERVGALSRELGVSRAVLWEWRRAYEAGGVTALRSRGRPRPPPDPGVPPASVAAGELAAARARIAALERTVGQQKLELDFLEGALRRLETARRAASVPGAPASTPRSGR